MEKYYIVFGDTAWPVAEITIFAGKPEQKAIVVATTDLDEALHTEPIAYDAQALDVQIAYYIRPEQMRLSLEEIASIVETEAYDNAI